MNATLVKIGGNVIDSPEALRLFCRDFVALSGPKILVHGGGALASKLSKDLGLEPQMIEGRRVTDPEALRITTMVYAGWCNKEIVSLLQGFGCNAIGLSGCDGDVLRASRRAPRTLSDGKTVVDYGLVGDVTPEGVNAEFLLKLLDLGLVPVISPINHDGHGQLLNTNADTVAAAIAASINAKLLYCFEKNGVLYDRNDPGSAISQITPSSFEQLKAEGRIAEGMIPKIEGSFAALKAGATEVRILNSKDLLFPEYGTQIAL